MTAYLICWKPLTENRDKGWPEEELTALAQKVQKNGSARETWRFSRKKGVKIGERVFLVQQGRRGHAILGYGNITGQPEKSGKHRVVPIEFLRLVDPRSGTAYATQDELRSITSKNGIWNTHASGIALPTEVAESLEGLVVGRIPVRTIASRNTSNPDWTRDELILALDFYLTKRPNLPDKTSKDIANLSATLNRLGDKLFSPSERSYSFRNENGVYMKLMNFRRLDPDFTSLGKKGLQRGAKEEEEVWTEFANDPHRCKEVARAIIASINDPEVEFLSVDYESNYGVTEAAEGRSLTEKHIRRERDPKLVKNKRKQALEKYGRLVCEICGFDFSVRYGKRGEGIIDCHHTKPLATYYAEGQKTHIDDLALVCSNCHRVIHSKKDWLSVSAMKALLMEH